MFLIGAKIKKQEINHLNKTVKLLPILYDFAVASLVDAWIKTINCKHTTWPRRVASLADAWIKIVEVFLKRVRLQSHPSWVRGLKCNETAVCDSLQASYSSRVRGLKNGGTKDEQRRI